MGGFGSGGWNALGRPTTNDARRLDVAKLRRAGALKEGWRGLWGWRRGDRGASQIAITGGHEAIVLRYRFLTPQGDWRAVVERAPLAWRPCRYGGERPFFVCVGCGAHRLHLYAAGPAYRCRECLGLTYQSRRERAEGRAISRARAIRIGLGGPPGIDEPYPSKPKGMRWATYERRINQLEIAEAASECALAAMLARIQTSPSRRGASWAKGDFWA